MKVLALGPFQPGLAGPWTKGASSLDRVEWEKTMAGLEIDFPLSLDSSLCPEGEITIHLRKLKEFHPDHLIDVIPYMKRICDAKTFLDEALSKGMARGEIEEGLKGWPGLPGVVIEGGNTPKPGSKGGGSAVDSILEMVALPGEGSAAPRGTGKGLDGILEGILKALYRDEAFRAAEAAWRGLRFLIRGSDIDVDIVPVSTETLEETLGHLLPAMIQEAPTLILIDLPFDNTQRSMELLGKAAAFAETLLVPALAWVDCGFFHLSSWKDLKKTGFIPNYLEEESFAKWRRLKADPSSQWISLLLNRFLLRYPYGPDNPLKKSSFREQEPLWISPVWAAGHLMAKSFAAKGFATHYTNWQAFKAEDLALHTLDEGKPISTEASITADRMQQFVRAGLLPLYAKAREDWACMPGDVTVSGNPLTFQMAVSWITRMILAIKDRCPELRGADELNKILEAQVDRDGRPVFDEVAVTASKPDDDGKIPMRMVLKPSRAVLPSGRKVEMVLNW